jgi:uncharacterized protein
MEVEPTGFAVLSREECLQHLASHTARIGRLAFVVDGWPVVLPLNYALHHGEVVFRTSLGSKLDHVSRGEPVAFEVDQVDEEWRTGWSILIQGRGHEVTDLAEVGGLRRLPLQPWATGRRDRYVRISAERMSGRQIITPDT